jgi:hypothetical protein
MPVSLEKVIIFLMNDVIYILKYLSLPFKSEGSRTIKNTIRKPIWNTIYSEYWLEFASHELDSLLNIIKRVYE